VTIYLTRHAHAGKRSLWEGDDRLRPLSERGEAQANGLAARLGPDRPGHLMSSPYLRCMQTLEPLAAQLGQEVLADERLAEGADIEAAFDLLLSLDKTNGVACSHGDLIPPLLRALCEIGMEVDGPLIDQKGSLWIIETAAGRPVRGTYVPPTA
jgi:8-oxo-dGTP diphosphatase